jgi:tetratricopeptide (TPR) repeat protein
MNGETYCEPCVWKAAREAKQAGRAAEYTAVPDNSVCARCGAYSGDTADHAVVGKLPLCSTCAPQVTDWPYPAWLKWSLACLVLLLLLALVDGRRYFHAGRAMYIGERLVEQRKYEEALPYLQEALRIAPNSDKAVLLTAKAALLSGEYDIADKAIQGHNNGHFDDANSDAFKEVDQIWNRASSAVEKAVQASKLEAQEGHAAEAAGLMHEAANLYPEARGLAINAETFDEGAAFERKDYDGFLAIAQKQWKEHSGPSTAAAVASALACKYAVSGNPEYRKQSEDMMETARKGVQGSAEGEKEFQEYAERILYRLDSRQIIDKPEYDRKFRSQQAKTN